MSGSITVALVWIGGFTSAYLLSSLMFGWERKIALSVATLPFAVGIAFSCVAYITVSGAGSSGLVAYLSLGWLIGAVAAPLIRSGTGETSRETRPESRAIAVATGTSLLSFCALTFLVVVVVQPMALGQA